MYLRTAIRSSLSMGVLGLLLAVSVPATGRGQVPGPRPRRTQPPADTQQSEPPSQQPLENPNSGPPAQEPLVKEHAPPAQDPMPSTDEPQSDPAPSTDVQPNDNQMTAPSTEPAPDTTTEPAPEPSTEPAAPPPATVTTEPVPDPTSDRPSTTSTEPKPTPSSETPSTTVETPSTSNDAPSTTTETPSTPSTTAETPPTSAPAETAPGLEPSRVTVTDPSSSSSPMAPRSATATADGGLARRVRVGLTFTETEGGMAVRDVAPRSAADSAGIKPGDVFVAINATNVPTADALVNRLQFLHAGEPVTVNMRRDGQPLDVQLVPVEAPREGDLEATVEYGAFAGSKGRLRSVWSFPKGDTTPKPAVLVVRGIGATAADAPGTNMFRDLAFKLARAGVIVVRYDPQGVGDSQGLPNATVDFDAEVADARAALEHVRGDARVDPDRIVVIGQGTGGGVAAVLASTDAKLAGLGVLGTIARPLMEYLLDSRRQQMALAGVPPGEADDILHEHVAIYAGVIAGGRLPGSDPYGIVGSDGTLMGKSSEYWREYDRVNFSKIYSELKIPVLNAVGEYDFVSTLADHRAVADALKAGGDAEQVLVVLPGADHDLRTFDSRESAFAAFGSNDAPVNDRALSTIVDWVQAHVKGTAPAR